MFGKLLKAAVSVAITPATIVADTVTMGGVFTDQKKSYTGRALESAIDNLMDAVEGDD